MWVVEATRQVLRVDRRVFDVDEDTRQVAQEEVYDKEGKLVASAYYDMIQYYDVQVPWYAATSTTRSRPGRYLVTYLNNDGAFPTRWGFMGEMNDYIPSRLRSLGLE